jgi:hypothetical protein
MMGGKCRRVSDMYQAPVVVSVPQNRGKLGRFNQCCLWFGAGNRRSPD